MVKPPPTRSRVKSSNCSTIRDMRSPLDMRRPRTFALRASGAAAWRFLSSPAAVMIAVSGARRSCASTPMNSSLTRIVSWRSSASCLARAARSRSAAWTRFSSCTELRKAISTCLRRAISAARSRDGCERWSPPPIAPDASVLPSPGAATVTCECSPQISRTPALAGPSANAAIA